MTGLGRLQAGLDASTVIDRSLSGRWIQTLLLAAFAAIALLLASVGGYGVIASAVGQTVCRSDAVIRPSGPPID